MVEAEMENSNTDLFERFRQSLDGYFAQGDFIHNNVQAFTWTGCMPDVNGEGNAPHFELMGHQDNIVDPEQREFKHDFWAWENANTSEMDMDSPALPARPETPSAQHFGSGRKRLRGNSDDDDSDKENSSLKRRCLNTTSSASSVVSYVVPRVSPISVKRASEEENIEENESKLLYVSSKESNLAEEDQLPGTSAGTSFGCPYATRQFLSRPFYSYDSDSDLDLSKGAQKGLKTTRYKKTKTHAKSNL